MTGNFIQIPFAGMAKRTRDGPLGTPGRKPDSVPPARSAFRTELARRIKSARKALGEREGRNVTQAEMARRLTNAAGYKVKADDYRKYEGGKKPSFIAHDLIFYFAEITGITVGTLLAPVPFQKVIHVPHRNIRPVTSRSKPY